MYLYGLLMRFVQIIFLFFVAVNCTKRQKVIISDVDINRIMLATLSQTLHSKDLNDIAESMESCSQFNGESFDSTLDYSQISKSPTDKIWSIHNCLVQKEFYLLIKKIYSSWFDGSIVPNTKWCGKGNNATNYDDLGSWTNIDRCCRDQYHCKVYLKPGEIREFADNSNSNHDILHCDCEHKFMTCLENENTRWSHLIGFVYFDLLARKCLAYDQLQECCLRMRPWHWSHPCLKYRLSNSGKYWQLWDSSPYIFKTSVPANGSNSCKLAII